MKTTRNLFSVLLLSMGVVLAACTSDTTGENPPPGPGPEPEGDGYFSLNLGEGVSQKLRAAETEVGEPEESNISNIRVVLYNNTTEAIEYVFDYNVTTNPGDGKVTGTKILADSKTTGIKTAAELIKVQAYKMLVLVNLQSAASNDLVVKTTKATGVTYSDLMKAVVAGAPGIFMNDGANTDNKHFFMSNWQEAVSVPGSALKPTSAEAEAAPIKVYVDRAVAKVNFQPKSGGPVVETGVILSDMAWKLDITNKTSFYVRHKANNKEGKPEIDDITYRDWFAATDPNMNDVSYERYRFTSTTPPSQITGPAYPQSMFNYIAKAAVDAELDADVFEYCFENTMDAEEQYEDVTTAAIVKLKYSVDRTALYDATSADVTAAMKDIAPGDPYFVWTRYAGTIYPEKYVFNAAALLFIRELETTHEVFAKNEALLDLQAFLVAKKTDLELPANFGTDFGRNNYTESVQYSDGGTNVLAYHYDLVNYYRVLIRHFSDGLQPTPHAWGRYGVVRNNVYYLTLNAVKGPGEIDIPKPVGPDDKFAWLAVDIEVLPWVVRRQPVEI